MASDEFDVFINADGSVQAVYDDDLAVLFEGEEQEVRRASHVEPAHAWCPHCGALYRHVGDCAWGDPRFGTPALPAVGWVADMSPVGGPVLFADGGRPFAARSAALAAERAWLSSRLAAGPLAVRP